MYTFHLLSPVNIPSRWSALLTLRLPVHSFSGFVVMRLLLQYIVPAFWWGLIMHVGFFTRCVVQHLGLLGKYRGLHSIFEVSTCLLYLRRFCRGPQSGMRNLVATYALAGLIFRTGISGVSWGLTFVAGLLIHPTSSLLAALDCFIGGSPLLWHSATLFSMEFNSSRFPFFSDLL